MQLFKGHLKQCVDIKLPVHVKLEVIQEGNVRVKCRGVASMENVCIGYDGLDESVVYF